MTTSSEESPNISYLTEKDLQLRTAWNYCATKELLKIYDEKCDLLDSGVIASHKRIWELVSKEMNKRNFCYTAAQCENKWKCLRRYYKTNLVKHKSQKRLCPFEKEIIEILNKRPQTRVLSQSINRKPDDSNSYTVIVNEPPSFCKEEREDFNILEVYSDNEQEPVKPYVIQTSNKILEEIAELKKDISENDGISSRLLYQFNDLQSKIIQYFESSAQRERQRLELKETKMDQDNEIVKQLKIQNSLLQKVVEKLNSYM